MPILSIVRDRVRRSICERARWYAKRERVRALCTEHEVSQQDWDQNLLRTLVSTKAILGQVPETLVDVGAHKGQFTRLASELLKFRHVLCIEPDSELIQEIRQNNPGSHVFVENLALSDTAGEAILHIHSDRSMSSLVPANPEVLEAYFPYSCGPILQRRVPVRTLDDVVSTFSDRVSGTIFLKLDTQGNELSILQQGTTTLARTRACLVEFMFCTPYLTDYNFRDLVDFFDDHDFECKGALDINRRESHEVSGVDFLFVRRGGDHTDGS